MGLNGLGKIQAQALAYRLKDKKFDRIYTSDLARAAQTTEEIEKYHANVPISIDTRLREQNLGDLTGKKWKDVKIQLKQEDLHIEHHLKDSGEVHKDFQARIEEFYGDIIIRHLVEPHNIYAASPSVAGSPISISPRSVRVDSEAEDFGLGKLRVMVSPVVSLPLENLAKSPVSPHPLLIPRSSVAQTPDSNTLKKRTPRPRIPKKHVLIITHGGWIKRLMAYLINLGFEMRDWNMGFPHASSIYEFEISKDFYENEYQWVGSICKMNNVSHLANLRIQRKEELPELPKKCVVDTSEIDCKTPQESAKKDNKKDVRLELEKTKRNHKEVFRNEKLKREAEILKAKLDAEEQGIDYERVRSLGYSAEAVEKYEENEREKAEKANIAFTDYAQIAAKKYLSLTKALEPDFEEYSKQKASVEIQSALKLAENKGIETDPNSSAYIAMSIKPSRKGIEKLVKDVQKQEARRNAFSKRRVYNDDEDVTFINERNARFNKKINRAYDKHTADIKEALERGTAI